LQHGSNTPFLDRMFDFDGLNAVLGTSRIIAESKKYGDDE